jgi:hypothetical protein
MLSLPQSGIVDNDFDKLVNKHQLRAMFWSGGVKFGGAGFGVYPAIKQTNNDSKGIEVRCQHWEMNHNGT